MVAHVLDIAANKVVCEVPRMGGPWRERVSGDPLRLLGGPRRDLDRAPGEGLVRPWR